jgi:tRNA G18 (ribose-2'-O)-methylase SpoU
MHEYISRPSDFTPGTLKVEYNHVMKATQYEIRFCQSCGLRYPLIENHPFGERCPHCLGTTKVVLTRSLTPEPASRAIETDLRLEALLDNVRSAWNVGSIFRTADGLGVRKLHLCGITPTPDSEVVTKTSLGAEEIVEWEYARNALETAKKLKGKRYRLIALEKEKHAIPLWAVNTIQLQNMILIVGNEITGIDPALLEMCDQIVYIPMIGRKRSLNVEVAFGIAAFHLSQNRFRTNSE